MNNYYDFSNTKMRCHGLHNLVCPGKTKTPKQQYQEVCADLERKEAVFALLDARQQALPSNLKKLEKIAALKKAKAELEPQKDVDPLSVTARTYLKRLYFTVKYGKESVGREKGNKYTNKGKLVEQDGLDLISFLDDVVLIKNDIRLEDNDLSGEPDAFLGENIYNASYLYEHKGSWDSETFSANIGTPLDALYWWQMQGYFKLTGCSDGEVSFCLLNTPESIIEGEKYALAKRMDVVTMESPAFKEAEAQLIRNMTFNDMPPQARRYKFPVKRDENAIKTIVEIVPKCRAYLFEFQEKHLSGVFRGEKVSELIEIDEV